MGCLPAERSVPLKSATKDTTFLNPGSHFFTLHTDSEVVNN